MNPKIFVIFIKNNLVPRDEIKWLTLEKVAKGKQLAEFIATVHIVYTCTVCQMTQS